MNGTVFGTMIGRRQVEAAVLAHLTNWMPTYIAEVERQNDWDPGHLPAIRNYTTVSSGFEKWTEDQFPTVLTMSTGLASKPKPKGDGKVHAEWAVGIASITEGGGGNPSADAKETAGAYFTAIRGLMLQHPSLGDFAEGVTWVDERYDNVPSESERTLATAYGMFSVEVAQAVDRRAGILVPLDNPYAEPDPWPSVTDTEADVDPNL